jgi:tetratricopeptide (TPR) repeat protein
MKKAIIILIILFFSFLYYSGFLTQMKTLPFSKDFFSIESPSTTERVWELKKNLPINNQVEKLYQLKLDKGIRNLPILSYLLIRETEQACKDGDCDLAVELANASIKFSPDLPQPYFALAQALWNQNHFQLGRILSAFSSGQIARFKHYPSALRFFYDTFYILSHAILLAFMIFGISVIIKYLPLHAHAIRKNFSQEIASLLINGLKIFVFLIPLFLRLDMLWAILFWSILLWGYVAKQEKKLLFLFLVILVYLPFFLRISSSFLNETSSDILLKIYQANHEEWDKTTAKKLEEWRASHPDDTEVLFTLGLIEKKEGRYLLAEEYYKKAIQKDPQSSEIFSNLGNVYLAQKQTQMAIDSYQHATALTPDKGAYYYNLYRAYAQETFLSGKMDQAFQKARQLDPKLVAYYSEIDSPNMNRLVIDEILTTPRIWRRFLKYFVARDGFLSWLFGGWFEKIPSRTPLLSPLVFLGFLIGMSTYSQARKFLSRCPMCGAPTYRFYTGTAEKELVCFNCYRIFIQKEKLHPKIAEKTSRQVRRFQEENEFVSRFLSLFFSGFGCLWKDRFPMGILYLILFFIFVLRFIYWNGVTPPSVAQLYSNPWRMIFWGGLFLIFYFFSVRKVFQLKPSFEAEKRQPPLSKNGKG